MHAPTLLVLAERIQQTERPTRSLDSEIAEALGAETAVHARMGYAIRHRPWSPYADRHWTSQPSWTSNVQDALWLMDGLLPGQFYLAGRGRNTPAEPLFGCVLFAKGSTKPLGSGEHPKQLAAAITAAVLFAKAAELEAAHSDSLAAAHPAA